MAISPTLPESEAPESTGRSRRSPYDDQTTPGDLNEQITPGSAPGPQPSDDGQRLRLPGTGSSTPLPQRSSSVTPSRPSPQDRQALSGGDRTSSPTRDYRPRYQKQPGQSLSGNPDSTSQTMPSDPAREEPGEPQEPTRDEPENEPVDLDREEPVYDPEAQDEAENNRPQDPARNPAAGRVSDEASRPARAEPSRSEVADREKSAGDEDRTSKPEADESDKLGRGFTGTGANPKHMGRFGNNLFRQAAWLRHRKVALALPIGGGLIALFFAIFIALAPLKLLSIVTNLEDHFFANATHATDKESEKLFEGYIKRRLIAKATCGDTIDISCKLTYSLNPVTRLWKGWAHQRLEDKMAKKYGISFVSKGGKFYAKFPGMAGDGADITTWANSTGNEALDEAIANSSAGEAIAVTRSQVRLLINTALKDATLYDQTAFKWKYLEMMAEKYGLHFCLFWCQPRDALTDSAIDQKNAVKLLLSETLQSRVSILRAGFNCLFTISGPCDDTTPDIQPCQEGVDCELGGVAQTQMDVVVETELRSAAAKNPGLDDPNELKTEEDLASKAATTDGLNAELETEQVANLIGEAGAEKSASSLVADLTWVSIAAQIYQGLGDFGPKVQHLAYLANSALAATYFQKLTTTAHECKSGHCNSAELGSVSDSFNHSNTPRDGGTASAEESPLYSLFINGNGKLEGNTKDIQCKGDKPLLSTGICPEEANAQGSGILNEISSSFKGFAGGVVYDLAKAWNTDLNAFFHLIFQAFGWLAYPVQKLIIIVNDSCSIPSVNLLGHRISPNPFQPYCDARHLIHDAIPHVIGFFQQHVVSSVFSFNMSGARAFNLAANGAAVLGNDTVHSVLGGVVDTTGALTQANYQEQQQEELAQYQQQPLLKRLTDTQSQYSPITKLAMAMPSGATDASFGLVSLFSNPFGSLSHTFASLFGGKAAAVNATDSGCNPYGVPCYVVPDQAIDAVGDQSDFWDKNCADNSIVQNGQYTQTKYDAYATIDPTTGEAVNLPQSGDPYMGTNPCLFIQAVACANSVFNDVDGVCSSEDNNGNPATGATSASASGATTSASSATSTTGTTVAGSCSGNGAISAVVGPGGLYGRVDQGVDYEPATDGTPYNICAPASGTITLADATGHQFNNTNGQTEIIMKLDTDPRVANSSQYIYFAEIIKMAPGIYVGAHVTKGQVIGTNDQHPGIEIGWSEAATHGFNACSSDGNPTPCGNSFDSWIKAGGG